MGFLAFGPKTPPFNTVTLSTFETHESEDDAIGSTADFMEAQLHLTPRPSDGVDLPAQAPEDAMDADEDHKCHHISYLPAKLSSKASKEQAAAISELQQQDVPKRVRVYQRREGSGGVVREAIQRLELVAASTGSMSPERQLSGEQGSPLGRTGSEDQASPLGRMMSSEQTTPAGRNMSADLTSPLGRKPSFGLTADDRTLSRTSEDPRMNGNGNKIQPVTPDQLARNGKKLGHSSPSGADYSVPYAHTKVLHGANFHAVVTQVTKALKQQGFRALSIVDLKSTFRHSRVGNKDYRNHTLITACHVRLLYKCVYYEPSMALLPPCNVVIMEGDHCIEDIVVQVTKPSTIYRALQTSNPKMKGLLAEIDGRVLLALNSLGTANETEA